MLDHGPSGLWFYVCFMLTTCKTFYRYAVEEQEYIAAPTSVVN